ncbi:hypothetical protein SY83_07160 [Paenibacillus swuensis]|uniref:Uncharacterized protein n=1 Tax=Paenibacillus swuensis TaxID=1178515 RepID=A0A172TGB4_9BACL|nr:hypothetical protein [Paenibacillus swuensis]ANE46098.1 hypothetical protein SY83_07160 [Paenibacillus swuensis]
MIIIRKMKKRVQIGRKSARKSRAVVTRKRVLKRQLTGRRLARKQGRKRKVITAKRVPKRAVVNHRAFNEGYNQGFHTGFAQGLAEGAHHI